MPLIALDWASGIRDLIIFCFGAFYTLWLLVCHFKFKRDKDEIENQRVLGD